MRQVEFCSQQAFAAGHLAVVGLVVVTGKVQKTVQDEDFDLCRERVALLNSLTERRRNADGQVASNFFLVLDELLSREREDVRSLVFAAKLAIEAANSGVSSEQYGDLALEADGSLGFAQKR